MPLTKKTVIILLYILIAIQVLSIFVYIAMMSLVMQNCPFCFYNGIFWIFIWTIFYGIILYLVYQYGDELEEFRIIVFLLCLGLIVMIFIHIFWIYSNLYWIAFYNETVSQYPTQIPSSSGE